LHWYFGKHQFVYNKAEPVVQSFEQEGVYNVQLRTEYRACEAREYSKPVYVFPNPEVYLGDDSSICYQGKVIVLKNQVQQPTNTYHYEWSTGDTTESIGIVSPGHYSLNQMSEPIGCSGYGSIEIAKDCFVDIPNAFTPNGDGINDYFFPRQWLSNGIINFHLQIFNRWGELVYETKNTDGLGWDGRLNGQEQPSGVYVYRIIVTYKNGTTENYDGNVTLIR
jgi:gliding motility-associated-like protein